MMTNNAWRAASPVGGQSARLVAARYRFVGRAIDPIRFPWFPGNVFHGGLGHALRGAVCVTGLPDCRECGWRERCLYMDLFRTRNAKGHEVPHPFVLEPPEGPVDVRAGGAFIFHLVLIGRGCGALPTFVSAVDRFGRAGIGRPPARFALEEVQALYGGARVIVYTRGKGFTAALPRPENVGATSTDRPTRLLDVRFSTPAAILDDGRVATRRLPFPLLYKAIRRRLALLAPGDSVVGGGDGDGAAARLRLTEVARTVDDEWTELESTRIPRIQRDTGRWMYLGGVRGTVRYRGDLDAFMPYLRAAELVHVGNWTSFGFGRIEVTPLLERQPCGAEETARGGESEAVD